jgi:4-aminobutyrate aminotransferase/(S)-3-amino-2-methylpropionate transaminase
VLDVIERENLLKRSMEIGETIMGRLRALEERLPIVGDVRGRGAMCAVELVEDRATKAPLGADRMATISRRCLEQGVIVLTAGTYGNVLRLLPPLNIEPGLLDEGLRVVEEALTAVA